MKFFFSLKWFNFSNFSFLFEGIFTVLPKNKVCYVMFFCYLIFFMLFINFYVLPVTCYLRFCLNGYTFGHEFLRTRCYWSIHLGVLISHVCQEMLWTESSLSMSSGKWTCEWAAKLWGPGNMKSSHFLSLHLAPASHFACDSSQRACSQTVEVFIFVRDGCVVIIMAHSMPSVPTPPKASAKCWHHFWLPTSEQEQTKLLKLSSLARVFELLW